MAPIWNGSFRKLEDELALLVTKRRKGLLTEPWAKAHGPAGYKACGSDLRATEKYRSRPHSESPGQSCENGETPSGCAERSPFRERRSRMTLLAPRPWLLHFSQRLWTSERLWTSAQQRFHRGHRLRREIDLPVGCPPARACRSQNWQFRLSEGCRPTGKLHPLAPGRPFPILLRWGAVHLSIGSKPERPSEIPKLPEKWPPSPGRYWSESSASKNPFRLWGDKRWPLKTPYTAHW